MRKILYNLYRQNGYSFIELIILIILISLIAATVLLQFHRLKNSTEVAACKANQAALNFALVSHLSLNGTYPESVEDLAPFLDAEQIPECPSGGTYSIVNGEEIECSIPEHE
jgi:type II secretory pathway pseudopilin PulG